MTRPLGHDCACRVLSCTAGQPSPDAAGGTGEGGGEGMVKGTGVRMLLHPPPLPLPAFGAGTCLVQAVR